MPIKHVYELAEVITTSQSLKHVGIEFWPRKLLIFWILEAARGLNALRTNLNCLYRLSMLPSPNVDSLDSLGYDVFSLGC